MVMITTSRAGLLSANNPGQMTRRLAIHRNAKRREGTMSKRNYTPSVNPGPGTDHISDYASLSDSEGSPRTADLQPHPNLERCSVTTKEGSASRYFPGNRGYSARR